MTEPKFELGQWVQCVSGITGQVVHERTQITERIYLKQGDIVPTRHTRRRYRMSEGSWLYAVADTVVSETLIHWAEFLLRHIPDDDADEAFERFKKKLDLPVIQPQKQPVEVI